MPADHPALLQCVLFAKTPGKERGDPTPIRAAINGNARKMDTPWPSQNNAFGTPEFRSATARSSLIKNAATRHFSAMWNVVCRENAAPHHFARIPTAKPLSIGAETALRPFINGKTTCSINQPHTLPPAPPARSPDFASSNLPASGLVRSHA
jgi:hypothetical protein